MPFPRRPTGDPRRYLIPASRVPEELAAVVAAGDTVPTPARPASTVAVVREGLRGPEVLLLRRPAAGFAAGAWVFPGGKVDSSDYRLSPARAGEPQRWAKRLGMVEPLEAWAYVVAGIRETWEETGLLIGDSAGAATRLRAARRRVLEGAEPFPESAATAGYRPLTASMIYLARWITPVVEPRRYDTRFFLAVAKASADVTLAGGELLEARWLEPGAALNAYEMDKLPMFPPTVDTLRRIRGFASTREMLAALRQASVPSFLPRMRPHPDGVIIEVQELETD